jgi:hypothetical protein
MVNAKDNTNELLDIEKANARRTKRRSTREKTMFIIDTLTEFDIEYLDRLMNDLPIKWNHLMPCGIAEVFCNAPLPVLDRIWSKLARGNPLFQIYCNLDNTLTEWKPSQFENKENRLYESFCPAIMCMKTQPHDYGTSRMIAYKSAKYSENHNEKKRWFAFPSLNYLPTDVKKVLAGDGGLLVCHGGKQPRRPPIPGERLLPLTHDEEDDYDRAKYPEGQAVMLVTNPLTREYYFLPPIPKMILQEMSACIIMTPREAQTFNMRQSRIASFLEKRRSSASLVGHEAYSFEPNEYYPPGVNPTLYKRGHSFREGRVWQHNNTIEMFQPKKVEKIEEIKTITKKDLSLPPKIPLPRPTMHESVGLTPGFQRKMSKINVLMKEKLDIHDSPRTEVSENNSESSVEIEVDPYHNRLEEHCHHYIIISIGYYHQCADEDKAKDERLVLAIYKSIKKEEGWWLRPLPFISRLMPLKEGRTALAFLKKDRWMAVCFGGILVEEHLEEVPPKESEFDENEKLKSLDGEGYISDNYSNASSKKSKNSNNSNSSIFCPPNPNRNKPPIGDPILPKGSKIIADTDECGNVVKKLWCEESSSGSDTLKSSSSSEDTIPPLRPEYILVETTHQVIFYVPVVEYDDSALAFSFNPFGTEESYLQCPIIVQPFGWQSTMPMMYAVTRNLILADTIMIFAIGFDTGSNGNPIPSGNFILVTEMPTSIFNDIFQTIDYSQKQFECTGGNGLICIRVIDIKVVAIYDICKKLWYLQEYAKYLPTKAAVHPFQMFENCVYEPSWWQKANIDDMDNNIDELIHHCTPEKYLGCFIPK